MKPIYPVLAFGAIVPAAEKAAAPTAPVEPKLDLEVKAVAPVAEGVIAIPFVDPHGDSVAGLERARVALRDRLRVATTIGFGPRFLHSTGQLHKGGPDTGVFVQVVGDDPQDVPIPDAGYGFSTLKHAQADGDLLTLQKRGRPVGRVRLDELLEVAP